MSKMKGLATLYWFFGLAYALGNLSGRKGCGPMALYAAADACEVLFGGRKQVFPLAATFLAEFKVEAGHQTLMGKIQAVNLGEILPVKPGWL